MIVLFEILTLFRFKAIRSSWLTLNEIMIVLIAKGTQGGCHRTAIEDCVKDGGEEFLPRCIAFEFQIFDDSMGIRLKSAVYLGKNSSSPSLA